jgi:hypothetical protein
MVKRISLALLGLSLAAHSPIKCYSDNEFEQDIKKVGIVSGVVLAATAVSYGVYKIGSWLLSKTDQQILMSASQNHNDAYTKYHPLFDILENWYHNGRSARTIDEALLYEMGMAKLQGDYIGTYLKKLDYTNRILRNELDTVKQRHVQLQQTTIHNNVEWQVMIEFQELAARMSNLIPRLEFLSQFLHYHQSYFVLYEEESDLYGRYDRELRAMSTTADYHSRIYEIKTAILEKFSNYQYPYLKYKEKVDWDVQNLNNIINRLAYNYYDRISAARQLYNYLVEMRELVMHDSHYYDDVQAKKHDEQERERREFEERKIRALERKAAAQERKVRELEEQNRRHAWCGVHKCHDCITCCPCTTSSASLIITLES